MRSAPVRTAPRRARFGAPAIGGAAPGAAGSGGLLTGLRLDPMRLALFGLILVQIGRVHQHYSFIGLLRPGVLGMLVVLGYSALHPQALGRIGILGESNSKRIVYLFVLACISAPFGLSLGGSATYIIDYYSKVFLLWLFIAISVRHLADLVFLMWAYLLSAGFLAYLSIFVYQTTVDAHALRLSGSSMYMYDANDVGVIMLVAVPLALLVFQTSGRWGKLGSGLILGAMIGSLALGGSRGAFLGLITLGGVLLLFGDHFSVIKRIGAVALIVALLVAFAPPGYWRQMETIIRPEEDYNRTAQEGRMQIWKRGVGYFAAYPIFGVGIQNFGRAEGTISPLARNAIPGETRLLFQAPHNSYLQAAAELGVGGLYLWPAIVFGALFGFNRLRKRLPQRWRTGSTEERFLFLSARYLLASWAAFAVSAFFVSFAWLGPIYLLAAYSSAVFVLVNRKLATERGSCANEEVPLRAATRTRAQSVIA
jgi:O-antigen ligase